MASYTKKFKANYEEFQEYLVEKLKSKSHTIELSDMKYTKMNDVECTVYVFERFSMYSSNYVSMNITLLHYDGNIELFAITSGGSSGLLRMDTYGEETFLQTLIDPVEEYVNGEY